MPLAQPFGKFVGEARGVVIVLVVVLLVMVPWLMPGAARPRADNALFEAGAACVGTSFSG